MEQISQIIDEIYVNRSSATFNYELKNVASFLESGTRHNADRRFYCRGIEWTLLLDIKVDKQTKFLSVYLSTQDNQASNWQIKGDYEIKILNQLGHEDRIKSDTAIFKSSKFSRDFAWGYVEFAKLEELTDPSKGFLKNDTILFEVNLKADRMLTCDPTPS